MGLDDPRPEGETAAKGTESKPVSQFGPGQEVMQAEWNAAGRGVSVVADIAENLGVNAALDGINDPLVCLVGDDHAEVIHGNSIPLACPGKAGNHRSYGLGKNPGSLHLDKPVIHQRNRKGATILSLGREVGTVQAGNTPAEMVFPVEQGRGGGISKQDGGVKIRHVEQG